MTLPSAAPVGAPLPPSGFGRVVFVMSGKGGVGKSTIAANLAAVLAKRGATVGLLDADLHGPSQSEMFAAFDRPQVRHGLIQPPQRHNVRLLSSGMLGSRTKAFAWRGPILRGVLRQFIFDTDWGSPDYFLVDLPPGTGETLISLLRWLTPNSIIVVSTPQEVAASDTRRALRMLQQLEMPLTGLVENMATYTCPICHSLSKVFPGNGGEDLTQEFGITNLLRLPLLAAYAECGDAGQPAAVLDKADPSIRQCFDEISVWVEGGKSEQSAKME